MRDRDHRSPGLAKIPREDQEPCPTPWGLGCKLLYYGFSSYACQLSNHGARLRPLRVQYNLQMVYTEYCLARLKTAQLRIELIYVFKSASIAAYEVRSRLVAEVCLQ